MDVVVTDNSEIFLDDLSFKILQALETCGLVAEGYAKRLCPVDTGRLRNSITHSVEIDDGSGVAYIGTNVEYAPYVEMGTSRTTPQPFLKPAVADHASEYRRIVESIIKG